MEKVVLFANSTWCLYNFRLNLMRKLIEHGCEVYALAPLDPTYDNDTFIKAFQELGVQFRSVELKPRGLNPFGELSTLFSIFKELRSIKPDAVLSYTVKCNLYAGFCRQILGFKQIANVPGLGEVFESKNALHFLVSCLYRVAFRGMSTAFFQNSEDLKYCLESKLVPGHRCIVIPGSGVDLERFRPSCPPRHGEKRVFMMFGRVLPQKGYKEYLEACMRLKATYADRVECRVMGIEDKNRPDSTTIYQKLREADQARIITLVPTQVDVVPVLESVDAIVLPSRYNEGIPRSLLEASAMGKAIVTTNWRGCKETVDEGQNGFLVSVNNVEQLYQAMSAIVEMSPSELRQMGEHSRELAERRYDEAIVIREYLRATLGEGFSETVSPPEYDLVEERKKVVNF